MTVFDGLDLGWHYTSSLDVTVTHDLAVTSGESSADEASAEMSLGMSSIGKITLGRDAEANNQTYYALSASPDETITGASDGVNVDVGSCQPAQHAELWNYNDNLVSRVAKPDDCFRLTVDHGLERNYLDPYTVTMAPKGADVSWGPIPWWMERDDLTCPSMTWEAAEQVDVCAMFEEEVDRLPTPSAEPVVIHSSLAAGGNVVAPNTVPGGFATDLTLAGFDLKYEFDDEASVSDRFASMWYLDDTTTADKEDMWDLYYSDFYRDSGNTGDDIADPSLGIAGPASGGAERDGRRMLTGSGRFRVNDADAANTGDDFRSVWIKTLDLDSDPIYGDLGKLTFDGGDQADNFLAADDSNDCTADDGGSPATGTDGADRNSTLCDAHDIEISSAVTFVPAMGDIGCDPITVSYALTCDWDADGNMKNLVAPDPDRTLLNSTAEFVSCTVEKE